MTDRDRWQGCMDQPTFAGLESQGPKLREGTILDATISGAAAEAGSWV